MLKATIVIIGTLSPLLVCVGGTPPLQEPADPGVPPNAARRASPETSSAEAKPDAREVLRQLAAKAEEALRAYLSSLADLDKSHFSSLEIDVILEKLLAIQESDPYQIEKSFSTKHSGRGKRLVYPNRKAASKPIYGFKFQKVANQIRALPMAERVAEIVAGIRNPHQFQIGTATSFAEELVVAGKAAVPFLVKHKPQEEYHRRLIVLALAETGDPRGIPYVLDALTRDEEYARLERSNAAKALARFQGEEVLAALISALEDPTYEEMDMNQPQVDLPGHKPYLARHYSVRHEASRSLALITGQDWGFLYNEDPRTWSAWFKADDKAGFAPQAVARSERDLGVLLESLFHRFRSASAGRRRYRRYYLTTREDLETASRAASRADLESIGKDLEGLGKSVVPILLQVCADQVASSPLWRERLEGWTKELLLSLPWAEAARSAERLGK